MKIKVDPNLSKHFKYNYKYYIFGILIVFIILIAYSSFKGAVSHAPMKEEIEKPKEVPKEEPKQVDYTNMSSSMEELAKSMTRWLPIMIAIVVGMSVIVPMLRMFMGDHGI